MCYNKKHIILEKRKLCNIKFELGVIIMVNFKELIAEKIAEVTEIEKEEILGYIEIPPNDEMGDYAFPCFKLAKVLRKAPNMIAEDLKSKLETDENIVKIEIVGGYLNFYINKLVLAESVLKENRSSKTACFCRRLSFKSSTATY